MSTVGSMIDKAITDWKYIPTALESGKLLDKTVKFLSSSLDNLMFYNLIVSQSGRDASEGLKKPFKAFNELFKCSEIVFVAKRIIETHLGNVEKFETKGDDKASKPSLFRDISWLDRALIIGNSFNALESLQTYDFLHLSSISKTLEYIPGWNFVSENLAFTTVKDFAFLSATSIALYTDANLLYNFKDAVTEDLKLKKKSDDKLTDLRLKVIGHIAKAALLTLSLVLNSTSYRTAYLVFTSVDLKALKQPIAWIGATASVWSTARKERLDAEAKASKAIKP